MMKNALSRRLNCIIDARVSTDKQLQGKGLDDQEAICNYFAEQKGWRVLEVFSKSYSGRSEERADFELIKMAIRSNHSLGTPVDYYVVKSIDRLTRLGSDVYSSMQRELADMGVQLIDTRNIIQPSVNTLEHLGVKYDWSTSHPSRKSELLEAEKSRDEVTDILTRMIGAEIGLTRQGFSMRAANDGYQNTKEIIDGQEMSVAKQNTNRAHYFQLIYDMRASGKYTDQEIVEKVNALGYKSIAHKKWKVINSKRKEVIGMSTPKLMTVKQLQKLIKRTMYAGVKYEVWNKKPVWLKLAAGEEPIVGVETFNKANRGAVYIQIEKTGENAGNPRVLYNYTQETEQKSVRKKYNPIYKYDKMVLCDLCNKPLKNSGTKGNIGKSGVGFHGYHCDRIVNSQKHYYRIPKKDYEKRITDLLQRIEFSEDFKDKLEERLIKKYREREKEVLGHSIIIADNVTDLKREQQSLFNSFNLTSSDVMRRNIEERVEEIERRIIRATEERDKMEIKERDVKDFVKYAKGLVEHPAKMLANNNNPLTQRALFDLVFEEPLTHTQVVNGTPKLTFIFKLSGSEAAAKSSLVTLRRIELRFLG